MEIKQGVELPKKQAWGRPRGRGKNLDLLNKLRPEDTVWDVTAKRMRSIIVSANEHGFKLMVRNIPNTKRYAFRVLENESKDDKAGGVVHEP
jgi:hypothetical protein